MNYILQLTGFFQRVASDNRLNPTHVSLYMAIFQFWNAERFQNPVSISRQELMRISKISAKATYHKCIKDLHNFGYIKYIPSFNPFKGSLVYLFDMQSSARLISDRDHTKIETSIEQALVPYLNNINSLNENIENDNTQSKNDIVVKVSKNRVKVVEVNGEKVNQKETKNKGAAIPEQNKRSRLLSEFNRLNSIEVPPKLKDVLDYFATQKSTGTEANKFYNYFQSNGWKIGGKAPMEDWQAAARNWIINIPAFTPQHQNPMQHQLIPGNLSATTTKNYSEPL
ncbi:MAG: hypothetical protein ACK5L7_09155 [Paludibacteraceae bacterium]